jgi:hypothetical protein
MTEQEAAALRETVERRPGGWLAEVFEGVNGHWYLVVGRVADPLTHFVLRSRRDWERLQELLADAAGGAS